MDVNTLTTMPDRETVLSARPGPLRVLVAEDDVEMRRLLTAALQRVGMEVIEASDGLDLLRRFTEEHRRGLDIFRHWRRRRRSS